MPKKKQPAAPLTRALNCPAELLHVWQWFLEVLGGASGGGIGPAVVTWSDLLAWTELTGEAPEPREARLVMRLSILRANIVCEGLEKSGNAQG